VVVEEVGKYGDARAQEGSAEDVREVVTVVIDDESATASRRREVRRRDSVLVIHHAGDGDSGRGSDGDEGDDGLPRGTAVVPIIRRGRER
jgi:hypothetical protein